jgi:hypothetical protein
MSILPQLALAAASAAVQPLQQGLWRVMTLVQGTDQAETRLICNEPSKPWIMLVVPSLDSSSCAVTRQRPAGGTLKVTATCVGGGGLEVTGTLQPAYFDVVAHRWGRVGANASARASVTAHGTLISSTCNKQG